MNVMDAGLAPETQHDDKLASFKAPPAAGTLGVWLFIAGLAIAFGWLFIGYTIIRGRSEVPTPPLPVWFWVSTFVLLVSSVTLHAAYLWAKMSRLTPAKLALRTSTLLGVVFLVLQTPGLITLVRQHRELEGTWGAACMLVLTLVTLHALHVIAGLIRLLILNQKHHTATADQHGAVHLKQMCLFWHFLAVVWLVMFGLLLWV